MIIFYNLETKEIYGTVDTYTVDENFYIKPDGVEKSNIGRLVVDREWEKKNPELVENITHKKVKDVGKLEFEDDKKKLDTSYKKDSPCQKTLKDYLKKIEELEAEVLQLKGENKK